ncbi:MAG: hypothetical protein ABH873_03295 [Candidatus Firestonebacteria bacterium]
MKKLIPILIVIGFIVVVSGCISENTNSEVVQILMDTPENSVESYIKTLETESLDDDLMVGTGIFYESDYIKKELNEGWLVAQNRFTEKCNEVKNYLDLGEEYDCPSFYSEVKVDIISIEKDYENDDNASVTANFIIYYTTESNTTKTSKKNTFYLKKIDNEWKIENMGDENRTITEEALIDDVNYERERLNIFINAVDEYVNTIDNILTPIKEFYLLKENVKSAVADIIPNSKIKLVDVGIARNSTTVSNVELQKGEIVVDIVYYYEDEFLVDDYERSANEFSNIYKNIFNVNRNIKLVLIKNLKKEKDAYGYYVDENLMISYMTRATFNKINWNAFESTNLDEVTSVSFYGSSIVKSLRDFQDILEDYVEISNSLGSMSTGDMPSSICSDVESQCTLYGECEEINILKSSGIC